MDFRIDATLPASAAQLWAIFFDVQRVAGLIPGCENVTEVEPLKEFSALMKQKIGPFKLELPTSIVLGSYTLERYVELSATGRDKFTGTTIDVRMKVNLEEKQGQGIVECVLGIEAEMQVAGKLASLGYPVVKKRSEELFGEFERRLRNELAGFSEPKTSDVAAAATAPAPVAAPAAVAASAAPAPPAAAQPASIAYPQPAYPAQQQVPAPRPSRGVEMVLQWPRVGVSVAVACVVAYAATTAFHQSPGWWLVAPMLGVAAGLGRRAD
ncbi:MAG: SRPBCC domain-containing protein [Pseudomonadota bacterium]